MMEEEIMNSNLSFAYKVVRRTCFDELVSCIVRTKRSDSLEKINLAGIEYIPHKFVYPLTGNGPLTAFDTLEHAEKFVCEFLFADYVSTYEIWKAIVKIDKENIGVWKKRPYSNKLVFRSVLPEGTVLCKSIKILKRIT